MMNYQIYYQMVNYFIFLQEMLLQNLEKAIRQTFLKVNQFDANVRKSVYASIWKFYENALKKHTDNTSIIEHKKQQFIALTQNIESEFSESLKEPPLDLSNPKDNFQSSQEETKDFEKNWSFNDKKIEEVSEDLKNLQQNPFSLKPKKRKFKKRTIFLFILILLWIIFGVISLLFLYNDTYGINIGKKAKKDSQSPLTLKEEELGHASSSKIKSVAKSWKKLFKAEKIDSLKFQGNVKLNLENGNENSYVHIETQKGTDSVIIPLDSDILEKYKGKRVVFELIMRAGRSVLNGAEKKHYNVNVSCIFTNEKTKDCGVFHYELPFDRQIFILPTYLPKNLSNNASLIIKGDDANIQYNLDLYSVGILEND